MVNRIRLALVLVAAGFLSGCYYRPLMVPHDERHGIDRSIVETPSGFELQPYIRNLTDPAGIAFDNEGDLIIAEGSTADSKVRIFGFHPNGSRFDIYPTGRIPLIPTFQLLRPRRRLVSRRRQNLSIPSRSPWHGNHHRL